MMYFVCHHFLLTLLTYLAHLPCSPYGRERQSEWKRFSFPAKKNLCQLSHSRRPTREGLERTFSPHFRSLPSSLSSLNADETRHLFLFCPHSRALEVEEERKRGEMHDSRVPYNVTFLPRFVSPHPPPLPTHLFSPMSWTLGDLKRERELAIL